MSEAQQEPVEKKRVKEKRKAIREIEFELSQGELVRRAQEAADLRLAAVSIEEEFGRIKSTYKGRIEEKKNQLSQLLDVVRAGSERRVVEVIDLFDYEHAVVEAYYEDKVVERRVMTAEERQLGLGFEHVRPTKKTEAAQGELPLGDTTVIEDDLADLPPISLPDPKHQHQEETIINDKTKNQIVEFHGKSWLLEPHEMSVFAVVEEDVFGQAVLVWTQKSTNKIGPPPAPSESAPQ
jgi:hypothetical protein